MKVDAQVTAGVRTGSFRTTFLFFLDVLNLEVLHCDEDMQFVQFLLPSGEVLELFGQQNLWHAFTTPPEWELIVANLTAASLDDDPSGQSSPSGPDLFSSMLGGQAHWDDL